MFYENNKKRKKIKIKLKIKMEGKKREEKRNFQRSNSPKRFQNNSNLSTYPLCPYAYCTFHRRLVRRCICISVMWNVTVIEFQVTIIILIFVRNVYLKLTRVTITKDLFSTSLFERTQCR